MFFSYTAEKPSPKKRSQKSPAQEKLDHKVLTQATVLESKWLAAYYIYIYRRIYPLYLNYSQVGKPQGFQVKLGT